MRSLRTLPLQLPALRLALFVTMMTTSAGCSGSAVMRPRPEQLVEVPIGAFRIPLAPRSHRQTEAASTNRNSLLLRFELCVLVPPEREGFVAERMKSHEVRVRDAVIEACRWASLIELSDPNLGALKARLTKAVGKHIGPSHVRRVVISDVLLEPT